MDRPRREETGDSGARFPRRAAELVGVVLGTLLLLLVQNLDVFSVSVHETGDYAANSFLVERAKHLQLLHGNYSRLEFNHPGPAFLYVEAIAELVVFQLLPLVPAPHNAHWLGIVALNATFFGVVFLVARAHLRSGPVALAFVGGALFLATLHPVLLTAPWMPHAYFAAYLAFVVTVSSVGSGRLEHLPLATLSGGFLLHGHVCFPLFVLPPLVLSLLACLRRHRFQVTRLAKKHGRSLAASVVLVGLFVLPVLLHTVLHFPGEFGKYARFAQKARSPFPNGESAEFVLRRWSESSSAVALVLMAAALVAYVLLVQRVDRRQRRYFWALGANLVLASALVFFYAKYGVDDLSYGYVAIFYQAVPALAIASVWALAMTALSSTSRSRLVAAIFVALPLAATPLTNPTRSDWSDNAWVTEVEALLRQRPGADERTAVLVFRFELWPHAVGIVAEANRRGSKVRLGKSWWTFLAAQENIATPSEARDGVWYNLCLPADLDGAPPLWLRETDPPLALVSCDPVPDDGEP